MATLRRILGGWKHQLRPPFQRSYAQCAEDLLAAYLVTGLLGIEKPTYLDLGAHHPWHLSNTYAFYRKGSRGVCVEPDPALFERIRRARPRDVCLNVGVGGRRESRDLYILDDAGLNTFSDQTRGAIEQGGSAKVTRSVRVEIVAVNDLLGEHFRPWPNFVSLDTESMDLEILRAIDFGRYRPEAFCVETLAFPELKKIPEISQFMRSVGYEVYADTYINTLFVESGAWERRQATMRSLNGKPVP
jgi:FkbM family methyltransferase